MKAGHLQTDRYFVLMRLVFTKCTYFVLKMKDLGARQVQFSNEP